MLSVDYTTKQSTITALQTVDDVLKFKEKLNGAMEQSFYMEPVNGVIVQLIHFKYDDLFNKTFDFENGAAFAAHETRSRFIIK